MNVTSLKSDPIYNAKANIEIRNRKQWVAGFHKKITVIISAQSSKISQKLNVIAVKFTPPTWVCYCQDYGLKAVYASASNCFNQFLYPPQSLTVIEFRISERLTGNSFTVSHGVTFAVALVLLHLQFVFCCSLHSTPSIT